MGFSNISVLNRHHGKAYDVYIGRGTPFGNPFPITPSEDRNTVLRKFEDYLNVKAGSDPDFMKKLMALQGKKLACSCAPLPCHGHVIESFVEKEVRRQMRSEISLPDTSGMDIEMAAMVLARFAHGLHDQRRKYDGEPYINHPERVVRRLRDLGAPADVLAAAWLHDTLEDTILQPEDILERCSAGVLARVETLTDRFNASHGNRAIRNMLRNAKIAASDAWNQNIKLCDREDNLVGVFAHDKKFFVDYFKEALTMVDAFTKANPELLSNIRQFKEEKGLSL